MALKIALNSVVLEVLLPGHTVLGEAGEDDHAIVAPPDRPLLTQTLLASRTQLVHTADLKI